MPSELIITNGDSAAGSIKLAGLGDEVLPWRDVLHEGPVPDVGGLEALSELRGLYIASMGWIDGQEASTCFQDRDELLRDNEI